MKPDVYYHKRGLFVAGHLQKDYVVKAPTRANRLNKSGSAGLKMAEKYDLEHNKKGIVYIDHTAKAYVILPKALLSQPVGKDCQGVKNSIFSYNVNELVNQHNLELIPIPHEDDVRHPYDEGLAGEIRRRFGL